MFFKIFSLVCYIVGLDFTFINDLYRQPNNVLNMHSNGLAIDPKTLLLYMYVFI